MDLLRIGFVALVVLYHGTFIGPLVYHDLIPRNYVFSHQVGASLLLALSAYFVAATVRRGGTGRWWWGKLARLLPAFAVATVVAWTFLRVFAPDGWYYPGKRDLLANLLMLWHWDPTRWGFVDGSYWTIPVQLMAFTVAAVVWHTPLGRGPGLRALMWAALLVPLVQWPYRLPMPKDAPYAVLVDGLGLHRWHLFVAGVAIWMYSTGRLRAPHFGALLATCVLAHGAHAAWPLPGGGLGTDPEALLGMALGFLAILLAAVGPDRGALVPSRLHPAITWLAGISYGVFLVHQTVGYVVMFRLQELGVGPTLQTGFMMLAAVLGGWLLTRVVENPLHRRLLAGWDAVAARRAQRRRSTPPPPGAHGAPGAAQLAEASAPGSAPACVRSGPAANSTRS